MHQNVYRDTVWIKCGKNQVFENGSDKSKFILEEIKSRLNSGNICYHVVENIWSVRRLTQRVNIKICKTIGRRSQWPCSLRRGSWPVGCWDRGFESRLSHGCLSASFCVVLSCVGRGFATG
jgi:hypothetical protein